MKILKLVHLFASVSLACGGTASNSFNGTVRGNSFAPSDVISSNVEVLPGTTSFGLIVMTSQSGICGLLSGGARLESKSAKSFFLEVSDTNFATGVSTAPSSSGTYLVPTEEQQPAKHAFARFLQSDSNCNVIASTVAVAASGMVTVTSVSGGSYVGNFDFTLDSGDRVSGSFHASHCEALATPSPLAQCR